MKKTLLLLSAGIILLAVSACRKSTPHTSCVSPMSDTVHAHVPLLFSSCDAGSTYLWNFGDGSTATTDTVIHTYTTAGTYQVSLTTGGHATHTFTVTVLGDSLGYVTLGSQTFLPVRYDSMPYGQLKFVRDTGSGITFYFYGGAIPAPGSYAPLYTYASTVTPNGVALSVSGQYGINDSTLYTASPSNTQMVTVSRNQWGKLVISGNNIEVLRFINPQHDSMQVTFSVTVP